MLGSAAVMIVTKKHSMSVPSHAVFLGLYGGGRYWAEAA